MGELRQNDGLELFCFCSHLDHTGMGEGRKSGGLPVQSEQAQIMIREVDVFCGHSKEAPRVLMGDFNSWREKGAPRELLHAGYADASNGDDGATFVGFGDARKNAFDHIDWIFTKGMMMERYRLHVDRWPAPDGKMR